MAGEDVKERMNLLLQERQKQSRLSDLRRDTIRKVEFLRKKAIIEYHDVYQILRDFFKEFLEKRYEFTIKELRAELKKVYISNATRQKINDVLDQLEASEYASVHYAREDLLKILDDFEAIVNELIHVHTSSRSFLDQLKSFFIKEPDQQTIIAELPAIEGTDRMHIWIYTLVEKCYVALDKHNLHRAKASYDALLTAYNTLDDEKKAEYYTLIEQTYNDLLNRAKMIK